MILKNCVISFVLGEFPSISRCPTCENTHHHTQKEHLVEGSRSTHPRQAPHTGHPRNGELAPRASQKRAPPPPPTNSSQAMAIGIPIHHDTSNRSKPPQLYSLKRAFKQNKEKITTTTISNINRLLNQEHF